MKRTIYFIFLLFTCFVHTMHADDSDWIIHASYHDATKAVRVGSKTYVLASGSLFSYDKEDTSVETYDKTNALSDFGICDMAYCNGMKTLVLLYDNANVDLLSTDGECWNMPELKQKTFSDKTINELKVYGNEAFISTNSGVVVIDVKRQIFSNTYYFGEKITSCIADDKAIYAKTPSGVFKGDRKLNLLDASNWKKVGESEYPSSRFADESKALKEQSDKLLAEVSTIVPGSPLRNYSYRLNMIGNRLLVAGGHFSYSIPKPYTGTLMKYEDGRWSSFDEKAALGALPALTYTNTTDIIQDPSDPEHHFVGTASSGIYEFKDYKLVHHYTPYRTPNDEFQVSAPLTSILPDNPNNYRYIRTTALSYDHDGNIWMCNNECDTIVRIMKKDGRWTSLYYEDIRRTPTFDRTVFDQRGWAWINSRRKATADRQYYAGLLVINTNGTLDNKSDDQHRFITTFTNLEGITYSPDLVHAVCEDMNGQMWIGCDKGVFVSTDPENVMTANYRFTQIKVPRNDGSDLADYLMNGVNVTCIAIDGGNRKWMGTATDGVYLISADGKETVAHFTSSNSPLISNTINDIAVDGQTGRVYIATDCGLCSYQGNATDPSESMTDSSLKVFPNPVRPEYAGDVHITGLMSDTDVKIVTASGQLVCEGISYGGEFSWDCCYRTGKRVGSGIYYALCTDESGKHGACAKILVIK